MDVRSRSRSGLAAFVWRIVLTTGTGSIFALPRRAPGLRHARCCAPLFIVMSFAWGLAVFLARAVGAVRLERPARCRRTMPRRMRNLLGHLRRRACCTSWLVYHLTNALLRQAGRLRALHPASTAASIRRCSGGATSSLGSVAAAGARLSIRASAAPRCDAGGVAAGRRRARSRCSTSSSSAARRSRSRSSRATRRRAASATGRSPPTRRACRSCCSASAASRVAFLITARRRARAALPAATTTRSRRTAAAPGRPTD